MTISKSTLNLVVTILATAQKLGLTVERELANDSTLPENTGFIKVRVDGGTAELNIPKGHTKWMDSHIDWQGKAGYVPLNGTNGTVVCRIDPSKVDWALLLTAYSGANKRDRKSSSKTASQSTSELVALLKGMGLPAPQAQASGPDSPAPVVEVEDAAEEDFSDAS